MVTYDFFFFFDLLFILMEWEGEGSHSVVQKKDLDRNVGLLNNGNAGSVKVSGVDWNDCYWVGGD